MALAVEQGIAYNLGWYERYDRAEGMDWAKKALEFYHAREFITKSDNLGGSISLDVGCATGRYPLYFAQMGYKAYGFDISPHAIAICKNKMSNFPYKGRVNFRQKDIFSVELKNDSIAFVTSMMGTFNHFNETAQTYLAQMYFAALQPKGRLMLSLWDPQYANLGFLDIYTDEEKGILLKNSRTQQEMMSLFQYHGFIDIKIIPFCSSEDSEWMLHWREREGMPSLSYDRRWDITHGQMYLLFGEKPPYLE